MQACCRRAYLAVLAANGGLEAAMLTPLLPLTLQSVMRNITVAIQQVALSDRAVTVLLHWT